MNSSRVANEYAGRKGVNTLLKIFKGTLRIFPFVIIQMQALSDSYLELG